MLCVVKRTIIIIITIVVVAIIVVLEQEHIRSYIDGLVQERRNSIANALELRLSCTNPSIRSSV